MTTEKRLIYSNPAGFSDKKAKYQNFIQYADDFADVCKKNGIPLTAEIWAELWRQRTISVIIGLMQKAYQAEVDKLPEIMQKQAPPFNPMKQRQELQNFFDCLRLIENRDHLKPLLTTIGKDGRCTMVKDADQKIKAEFELYVENANQDRAVELCQTIENSYKELVEIIEKSGFGGYEFLHDPRYGMIIPENSGTVAIDYTALKDIK